MNESRFFRIVSDATYEQTRVALDAVFGMPAGETVFAPAADAPRFDDGTLKLAVRSQHCLLPEIATAIEDAEGAGVLFEVEAAEYFADAN
jgi:hypothetical protein